MLGYANLLCEKHKIFEKFSSKLINTCKANNPWNANFFSMYSHTFSCYHPLSLPIHPPLHYTPLQPTQTHCYPVYVSLPNPPLTAWHHAKFDTSYRLYQRSCSGHWTCRYPCMGIRRRSLLGCRIRRSWWGLRRIALWLLHRNFALPWRRRWNQSVDSLSKKRGIMINLIQHTKICWCVKSFNVLKVVMKISYWWIGKQKLMIRINVRKFNGLAKYSSKGRTNRFP